MVPRPSCLLKASPSLFRAVTNGALERVAENLFYQPKAKGGFRAAVCSVRSVLGCKYTGSPH